MSKETKYTCLGRVSKFEYLFLIQPYNRAVQYDIYHAGYHADLYCFTNTVEAALASRGYIKCRRPYRQYLLHLNKYKFKAGIRNRKLLKDIKDGVYINYDR